MTALLAGCAGGAGPRNTDSIRIILGHGAAPGNPRSNAALLFEELVEEKSDDAIDIQILGQETVGSDSEMMISVASGTLDMTINSQGPFATYVPEAALIGLPFLFENSQHAYAVIDSKEISGYLAEKAEERGFHLLGFWDNGMRDLTNSKHPIETPEDVAGLKIRTPDDTMTISIFNQLGANPTPMAFGELYLALRTGAVDGQENPVVNIKSSKLDEVQPNLAVTGHKYEANPFVISTARWSRLTPRAALHSPGGGGRGPRIPARGDERPDEADLRGVRAEARRHPPGQVGLPHPHRSGVRLLVREVPRVLHHHHINRG